MGIQRIIKQTSSAPFLRLPTIDEKVRILETHYNKDKLKREIKEYKLENGETVKVNTGSFWGDIKDNWTEKNTPHTTLTANQKARVEAALYLFQQQQPVTFAAASSRCAICFVVMQPIFAAAFR